MFLPPIEKVHFLIDEISNHEQFNFKKNDFYLSAMREKNGKSNKIMA